MSITPLTPSDVLVGRFLDQYPGFLTVTVLTDDRLVASNERSQQLLGYSLREFMTMDDQDLFGLKTPEDDWTSRSRCSGR